MSTVPDHGLKELVPVFGPEALGVGAHGSFYAGLERLGSSGDLKARLLLSALSHFAAKGYDGVQVKEVAEEAGVSKPTLYYHFGSKEGLFRQLCLVALAGMAVRRYFPKLAAWTGGRVVGLAGLAMTLAAVVLLAVNWHVVLEVRWQGIAALALLILMALIIGHLVGGPKEEDRSALAVACATRHIGVAVAVATSLPGARTAVVISIYIAISVAITLPYTRWRRVVAGRHGAPLK